MYHTIHIRKTKFLHSLSQMYTILLRVSFVAPLDDDSILFTCIKVALFFNLSHLFYSFFRQRREPRLERPKCLLFVYTLYSICFFLSCIRERCLEILTVGEGNPLSRDNTAADANCPPNLIGALIQNRKIQK